MNRVILSGWVHGIYSKIKGKDGANCTHVMVLLRNRTSTKVGVIQNIFPVHAFNEIAELVIDNVEKGNFLHVEGELTSYTAIFKGQKIRQLSVKILNFVVLKPDKGLKGLPIQGGEEWASVDWMEGEGG